MTDVERDEKIIEMHTDLKWIKAWSVEHKLLHSKYTYYIVITTIGLIVALIK